MIVQWGIGIVSGIVAWVVGLFPTIAPPSWLTDANSSLATAAGYVGSMGTWVPVPLVITVAGAVLACWVVGFGIKVVRILLSFLLAGGGSAG